MSRQLPEGWREVRLGDICENIVGGGTPSTVNPDYWDGHIPWMTSADIVNERVIKPRKYITNSAMRNSATNLVPRNNIIVVTRVGLGKVVKNSFDVCISQDSKGLILKEYVNPDFLVNALIEKIRIFKLTSQGSTIQGILGNQLTSVQIQLPPHREQKAIANTLQTWDEAIDKTESLIAAKERRFEWLCHQCFVPDSPINSSWERRKIGEFVKSRKEMAIPSEDMPLYSLTIEEGVTAKTDRYNREFLVKDQRSKTYKVVHPKDIVFNPANLRWGAIARSEVPHKVVISPIYEVFEILGSRIDSDYLTYALTCKRQIGVFATKTEGTLIERMAVKADAFRLCEILVPPTKEEQQTIAHILNTAQREIDILKQLANCYHTQKRGLMQKLLTGEWRLPLSFPRTRESRYSYPEPRPRTHHE